MHRINRIDQIFRGRVRKELSVKSCGHRKESEKGLKVEGVTKAF